MKLKNDEIGLYLEINDELLDTLKEYGIRHYPNEFGGILIGSYSLDRKTVNIVDTILPESYKSSSLSFERGSGGLKEKLVDLYETESSLIYVGEWHTHPNSRASPSKTDIMGMIEIANHPDVNIKSPILLIIGLTLNTSELGFHVFFNKKIHRYEID